MKISDIKTFVCRVPIANPLITSFGRMTDRPALFLRIEDHNGNFGWGEVWCNWPPSGAEYKENLIKHTIAPLLLDREFESPSVAFNFLTDALRILTIQTAEPGPFAHCLAGIDIALWDIQARKNGSSVARTINPQASPKVACYASGINLDDALNMIDKARKTGFTRFKVKIGRDLEREISVVREIQSGLRSHESLMLDANQGWNLEQAREAIQKFDFVELDWVEEPIAADHPASNWLTLKELAPFPIAAGENILGQDQFEDVITARLLDVVQPDICKWGGFSGVIPVARATMDAGLRYCPHYLGGIVGLLASAHVLSGVGGNGILEVDVNDNPLVDAFLDKQECIQEGQFSIDLGSGLGFDIDTNILDSWLV